MRMSLLCLNYLNGVLWNHDNYDVSTHFSMGWETGEWWNSPAGVFAYFHYWWMISVIASIPKFHSHLTAEMKILLECSGCFYIISLRSWIMCVYIWFTIHAGTVFFFIPFFFHCCCFRGWCGWVGTCVGRKVQPSGVRKHRDFHGQDFIS